MLLSLFSADFFCQSLPSSTAEPLRKVRLINNKHVHLTALYDYGYEKAKTNGLWSKELPSNDLLVRSRAGAGESEHSTSHR